MLSAILYLIGDEFVHAALNATCTSHDQADHPSVCLSNVWIVTNESI